MDKNDQNTSDQSKSAREKPVSDTAKKAKPKKDPRDRLYKPKGRPLTMASSPYSQTKDNVPKIMWCVSFALLPAIIGQFLRH